MNAHPHRYAGYRSHVCHGNVIDLQQHRDAREYRRRCDEIERAEQADLDAWLNRGSKAAHPVAMTALDVIACLLVAFAIGFMLAIGGAL